MILLALAAITYGSYLVTSVLGWIVGGFFIFMYCYGKHKIAEDQKRQQRIDATMDRITEEVLRTQCCPYEGWESQWRNNPKWPKVQ